MKITLSNSDGQRDFQSDVYYINNPSSCSLIDALHGFTGDLLLPVIIPQRKKMAPSVADKRSIIAVALVITLILEEWSVMVRTVDCPTNSQIGTLRAWTIDVNL